MTELPHQCMGCGRLYRPTRIHQGAVDPEGNEPLPASEQPAESGGYIVPGPAARHPAHMDRYQGQDISHGYCKDCARRHAAHVQNLGAERGAKLLGMTREEAAGHWWWRNINRPKNPRGRTKEEREREPDGD